MRNHFIIIDTQLCAASDVVKNPLGNPTAMPPGAGNNIMWFVEIWGLQEVV